MTARGVSTAVDTVIAVSLIAAAVTALFVLTPAPQPSPPDAGPALDALAVTTATVNTTTGPVRATVATHLAAAAPRPDSAYSQAVAALVDDRLDALPGRASVAARADGTVLRIGTPPPRTVDTTAAVLRVGTTSIVLRRWWP
ncbi:hypothetical protein [Salarchaeum sp. JOR-1]|uniref:DUF7262 family protein n=1 Tax=Salarchaeum sp. JOR-1 TaxID=2599399 RepID=UPI001198312C|nr:hypothetical protein [Salarchaeum sp. JOR-1]QDX39793.1 hypothetical protein FQU85_02350 [Salarchaeum sp. JOR-1]